MFGLVIKFAYLHLKMCTFGKPTVTVGASTTVDGNAKKISFDYKYFNDYKTINYD
jgi:hypothetical protein